MTVDAADYLVEAVTTAASSSSCYSYSVADVVTTTAVDATTTLAANLHRFSAFI